MMAIPLGDGTYGYCRALRFPNVAVYNHRSQVLLKSDDVLGKEVAFRISIMRSAFTGKRWKRIGQVPLSVSEKSEAVWYFMQDPDGNLFKTRDWLERIPATWSEIQGLECAAAWDPEHVEDRLRDHFAGRPSKWVESLKPQKV
jgi:hypothetical protein